MSEVDCKTYDEFKAALARKAHTIRVTDRKLAKKILLLMNLDKAAVLACLGGIAFAVANATTVAFVPVEVATNGGVSSAVRFGGSGVAITWVAVQVGWPAATAIMSIAIGLGGIGLLTALIKEYSVTDWSINHVVLGRRRTG